MGVWSSNNSGGVSRHMLRTRRLVEGAESSLVTGGGSPATGGESPVGVSSNTISTMTGSSPFEVGGGGGGVLANDGMIPELERERVKLRPLDL